MFMNTSTLSTPKQQNASFDVEIFCNFDSGVYTEAGVNYETRHDECVLVCVLCV